MLSHAQNTATIIESLSLSAQFDRQTVTENRQLSWSRLSKIVYKCHMCTDQRINSCFPYHYYRFLYKLSFLCIIQDTLSQFRVVPLNQTFLQSTFFLVKMSFLELCKVLILHVCYHIYIKHYSCNSTMLLLDSYRSHLIFNKI